MNNPVTFTFNTALLRRVACLMLAALVAIAGMPMLGSQHASAQQLSSRSIQMSDASTSGNVNITSGVGSGVGVTYRVSFTSKVKANSIIIDFCKEDPIINDTCTAPAGMSAASSTFVGVTGKVKAANNWSLTPAAGQLKLNNTTSGSSTDSISQTGTALVPVNEAQVFDINGVTNPNLTACTVAGVTNCTFYARIYTYANNTFGAYVSATNVGNNVVDYGGIALSTSTVITITARVQESLTFCVTAADPATWLAAGSGAANDCSASEVAAAPPALTLGHGSPTKVLDNNQADTASIWSQLSTNATSGAVINLVNSNVTCGGLSADNGATCAIPAVNGGAATAAAANAIETNAGTAAFGMFASDSSPATGGGVGTIIPNGPYHTAGHAKQEVPADPDTWYGMDTTTTQVNGNTPATTPGNVKGPVSGVASFGSIVASTASPTFHINNKYIFAATASLLTPAGIYTANLSMIATGTF